MKPDGHERGFEIRHGTREDATEAARLWMQSVREHAKYDHIYAPAPNAEQTMRRFLADLSSGRYSCFYVAEANGQIIGFLSGELREGSPAFDSRTWAAIEDIFVIPEKRSLGIGHALLAACDRWARERNACGLSLQVAAGNERARKFYEQLGFREVSVYKVREF